MPNVTVQHQLECAPVESPALDTVLTATAKLPKSRIFRQALSYESAVLCSTRHKFCAVMSRMGQWYLHGPLIDARLDVHIPTDLLTDFITIHDVQREMIGMVEHIEREVDLTIPMFPNMELAAAKTASSLAGLMNFDENQIDEIQLAIIETCINAFEHSHSKDRWVFIQFIMKDNELVLKIRDHGTGFRGKCLEPPTTPCNGTLQKRGWGFEIIRSIMDSVHIQSSEHGTTVVMTKRKRF